ncbi:MAG: DNA repair protein RadC [Gemmatimonadetes bacterium]|nr:DNA repair protein RadC [Gemmatimonadota bacterium]
MPALAPVATSDPPRERLSQHGPAALTAVELIAILLGTGRPGQPVLHVAQALHAACGGSLRRLARQTPGSLSQQLGVGGAKAARLVAALELGRRMMREARPPRRRIHRPEDVVQWVGPRLDDLEVEEFHILMVSVQRDVLRDVLVSRGTLDRSLVHPRDVFRPAIAEGAAALFLVHNHPSGDPTPSPDDQAVTEQLVGAGQLVGIPVLDHIVVAGGRWVSFAATGLL